jgi:hypothetical protein
MGSLLSTSVATFMLWTVANRSLLSLLSSFEFIVVRCLVAGHNMVVRGGHFSKTEGGDVYFFRWGR